MNFKTKTGSITKILYTILILCIVGIIVLSVYSLFNQNINQNDKTNLNNLNNPNSLNDLNNKINEAQNWNEADDIISNDSYDRYGDYESEEALKNYYRNHPSENSTNPAQSETISPSPTQPLSAAENAVEQPEIFSENANQAEELTPAEDVIDNNNLNNPDNPDNPDQNADLIIEPTEEAVEVISIPVAENNYIKPVDGNVLKMHNLDTAEYSVVMNDYRTHSGVDIESEIGASVKSACDGIISEIYDDPLMGKTITIAHADGVHSIYMNLQQILPENIFLGATVKCGDVIGAVGDSALIEVSDIAHLHFEMKKDGKYIDPFEYINF